MRIDVDPSAYKLIFDVLDQNKNGNIEYREFVAATIRKTLFKDLVLDTESVEIVDLKDTIEDFQEDVEMQDDGQKSKHTHNRSTRN